MSPKVPLPKGQIPPTAKPGFRYHGGRIRHLPLGRRGMEEKPRGALAVVLVLALTILVVWLGGYAVFFARG